MSNIPAIAYNADYLFESEILNFDVPVEIHTTRFGNNPIPVTPESCTNYPHYNITFENDSYKVFINSNEPDSDRNVREDIKSVIANHEQYDLILTTDKEILRNCSNAVLFPYGTTWLNKGHIKHPDGLGIYDEYLDGLCNNKKFEVSFLITRHCTENVYGYAVRRQLWIHQELITIPKLFYNSYVYRIREGAFSRMGLEDAEKNAKTILPQGDKNLLFNSQFHIAIESHVIENYFTEKLIDALITKTVPIYCGCPNIGEFFDVRGMIIVDNHEDIIESCNKLNQDSYEKMLPFIEYNYKKAKQYAGSFAKRVKKEIEKKINI